MIKGVMFVSEWKHKRSINETRKMKKKYCSEFIIEKKVKNYGCLFMIKKNV